jgi:hypothetical protein
MRRGARLALTTLVVVAMLGGLADVLVRGDDSVDGFSDDGDVRAAPGDVLVDPVGEMAVEQAQLRPPLERDRVQVGERHPEKVKSERRAHRVIPNER